MQNKLTGKTGNKPRSAYFPFPILVHLDTFSLVYFLKDCITFQDSEFLVTFILYSGRKQVYFHFYFIFFVMFRFTSLYFSVSVDIECLFSRYLRKLLRRATVLLILVFISSYRRLGKKSA